MDNPEVFEPLSHDSLARHAAGAVIAGIRFVWQQLAVADLNPHTGSLRGSIMPDKYLEFPDYPPVHDDTI